MVVVFLWSLVDAFLLEPTARRDIDFAADDGLDAMAHRLAVKFHGAEHVAVIGHRDRRLLQRLDALKQFIDLVRAVEEAVFGMTVKVNETRMLHCNYLFI